MKRTITTALALTLLCGTSAFAQERQPWARGAGGSFQGGQSREAAAALQEQRRAPPPQAQAQPQAQPQQERARPQEQARSQEQAQRPQGQPQGQRPQGQQPQGQRPQGQRPQGQQPQGAQQRPPVQNQAQNQARPDVAGRPGRPGSDSFVGRAVEEAAAQAAARARNPDPRGPGRGPDRPGSYDGRGPGGYDRPGGPQTRPPVIRPEDRRDRDRGRPRYDQRTFPRYVTPSRRYQWRGAPWRPPVGFYSFRWQYGQILPWTWYTPNYYLNDYWNYGLPRPPIGCEWVRAGDDAILVDVFTGRVYQVVYNLFW